MTDPEMVAAHERDYAAKRACLDARTALLAFRKHGRTAQLLPDVLALIDKIEAIEAQIVRTWD